MKHRIKRSIATLLLSIATLVNASEENWLQTAMSHLKNNEPAAAMHLLEPQMDSNAGDLTYDFLLGQAALANNQANLAVFALERAVLTAPEQEGARFTLAQAYVSLGEYQQASKELTHLANHSRDIRFKNMSRHLLSQLRRSSDKSISLFVRGGIGNDTNANSATSDENFLGLELTEKSRATPSNTAMGQITATAEFPMSRNLSFNLAANIYRKDYENASFVNTRTSAVNAGINVKPAKQFQEQLQILARRTVVDGQTNNDYLGTQLSHKHSFQDSNNLSATIRLGRTNYKNDFEIRSVNQINGGMQYQYVTHNREKDLIVASISGIAGKDTPVLSNSPYGRNYVGAITGFHLKSHLGRVSVGANLHYLKSDYEAEQYGKRADENVGAQLNLNVKLNSKWQLSPGVGYARNQSTVDLYNFERTQINFIVSHQLI